MIENENDEKLQASGGSVPEEPQTPCETAPEPQESEPAKVKTNRVADFFRSVGEAVKNFFLRLWAWFYNKFVLWFKGDEDRPSFKQRLVKIGEWFKKLPGRIAKFFKELPGNIKAIPSRVKNWASSLTKDSVKAFWLGTGEKKGFLQCFVSYAVLILFGFVYIYPMLYMLGYSLMSPSDVANPMVNYLPTSPYFNNYKEASQVLDFWDSLWQSIYVAALPAFFQTVCCCLAAYGLARFKFRGKKIIFALILLTFIIPSQLTMLPQLLIYTNLKLTDTILSFIVPAMFGQGIKSAVFILIFYQFFKGIPDSVVEAAKIDGAGSFQVFAKIGLPAAVPAILLSFLLSVVWYYNETVLSSIYFGGSVTTLPLELSKFQATYEALFGTSTTTGKSVNEAIYMAGTLLSILPLLVFYFFTQKHFTEGIDKAGITGE